MRFSNGVSIFVLSATFLRVCSLANAAALTPGDLLVTTDFSVNPPQTLYEYTTAGTKVESFAIPYPGGNRNSTEDLRGITVAPDGDIEIYNGTFHPYLTTLDPVTDTFTNTQTSTFSVAGNVTYGNVGAIGNYAFVPNQDITGAAGTAGVVRFNLTDGSSQRFLSSGSYEQTTIGENGLLYVTNGNEIAGTPGVEIYDPFTMLLLRTVLFTGDDIRSVAVDTLGDIYAADHGGSIYEFGPTGTLLNSRALGIGSLSDIALSSTGQIAVAGGGVGSGDVVGITNASLSSQSYFNSANSYFVSFTTPSVVPEPKSAALLLTIAAIFLTCRRGQQNLGL